MILFVSVIVQVILHTLQIPHERISVPNVAEVARLQEFGYVPRHLRFERNSLLAIKTNSGVQQRS